MKNTIGALLIISAFAGISACEEPAPATTADIEGTYIGEMSFVDSTFEQTLYSVDIEALPGSSLLITPSTDDATEWTSGVINSDGVFRCTSCSVNQLEVRRVGGRYQLTYTFEGNEQFHGSKQ